MPSIRGVLPCLANGRRTLTAGLPANRDGPPPGKVRRTEISPPSPAGRGLPAPPFADGAVSGLIWRGGPVEAQPLVLLQMELQEAHPDGVFVAGRQARGQGGKNLLAPGQGVGQGVENVGDQHGRDRARRGVFFRLIFEQGFHIVKLRYMKLLHWSMEKMTFFLKNRGHHAPVMKTGMDNGMDGADLKQEFRDLLRASGWSQAEAARQLAMTPSALSQIVRQNSPVRPSPVTLRLFQLLLWREKPETLREGARRKALSASEPWEQEVIRELRGVPPKTRQAILHRLKRLIEATRTRRRTPRARRAG